MTIRTVTNETIFKIPLMQVTGNGFLRVTCNKVDLSKIDIYYPDVSFYEEHPYEFRNVWMKKSTIQFPSWLLLPGNLKWLKQIVICAEMQAEWFRSGHSC